MQLSLIQYIDNVSKQMIFILGKDGILFIDKIILKIIKLHITYNYKVGRVYICARVTANSIVGNSAVHGGGGEAGRGIHIKS